MIHNNIIFILCQVTRFFLRRCLCRDALTHFSFTSFSVFFFFHSITFVNICVFVLLRFFYAFIRVRFMYFFEEKKICSFRKWVSVFIIIIIGTCTRNAQGCFDLLPLLFLWFRFFFYSFSFSFLVKSILFPFSLARNKSNSIIWRCSFLFFFVVLCHFTSDYFIFLSIYFLLLFIQLLNSEFI